MNPVAGLILEQIVKREYPDLPHAEGLEKVVQRYPTLWDAHTRQVQKGQVAAVSVPVQKAEPLSERDKIFAGVFQRAKVRAAQAGVTTEKAIMDILAEEPEIYQRY